VCVAHAHAGRTHTVGDQQAFFADARSDAQKARRTPTVFRYVQCDLQRSDLD